ncbi:hypothetical protein J8C02_10160 [Chloracidobacterium sp. MS 40/45]|jgi:hypothetical protein|uniref:DUF3592 domain-containing protein n=1 Tax=Chloracidobacterium aggregatum TaxID=2851959 RepID=UPI001B8B5A63|nr:DUF3592 domain-containing protein [Chloracidobacterium aggregatum]QUV99764.1 hypothetical protein J8C02_10160 [Chloracidobacterium sp. MS 40/45]
MVEVHSQTTFGRWRAWWQRLLGREDPEAARRRWLRQSGRIIEGEVLDIRPAGHGTLVRYRYEVASVEYESFDVVDTAGREHRYWPGQRISVRYDHRRPSNSILD